MNKLIASTMDHHELFRDAPTYPRALTDFLVTVPGYGESFGFKTTGAGGEDALLVIGTPEGRKAAAIALHARGWDPLEASFCRCGLNVRNGNQSVPTGGSHATHL